MKKASDLIQKLLDNLSNNSKFLGVFKEWKELVGPDLAAHAVIRDIEQGYLLVDVDHPGWMQKLQWRQRTLLKKIQVNYSELDIKGIKLYLKTIDNPK